VGVQLLIDVALHSRSPFAAKRLGCTMVGLAGQVTLTVGGRPAVGSTICYSRRTATCASSVVFLLLGIAALLAVLRPCWPDGPPVGSAMPPPAAAAIQDGTGARHQVEPDVVAGWADLAAGQGDDGVMADSLSVESPFRSFHLLACPSIW
jgi:hypothetical protein